MHPPYLIEGRIVHFVLPNGEHRGAIIARVNDAQRGILDLQVFTDGEVDGLEFSECPTRVSDVCYSSKMAPRTWHWVERQVS